MSRLGSKSIGRGRQKKGSCVQLNEGNLGDLRETRPGPGGRLVQTRKGDTPQIEAILASTGMVGAEKVKRW